MQAIVHPVTETLLGKIAGALPQSLLIAGERGIGLATIAREIAGQNLSGFLSPVDKTGNPNEMNGTISVEMIRKLHEQTRNRHEKPRVIIIDDADRMSPAAQASFLKLLEEPSPQTHFILTSHAPQRLLSTVRSRLQVAPVRPVTQQQTSDLLASRGIQDGKKRQQLAFIAAGLPAEINRLIQDDAYFKKRAEVMADARDLLTGTSYAKLMVVNKYQTDRSATLQLVDSTMAIARRTVSSNAQPALVTQLHKLLEVRERIAANGSARLLLARFVL